VHLENSLPPSLFLWSATYEIFPTLLYTTDSETTIMAKIPWTLIAFGVNY
jgi:hypothetical protein